MRRLAIAIGVVGALLGHSAQSDEVRPGYLELRQTASDTYSLLFKIPALGDDLRLAIYVTLPEGTKDVTPPKGRFNGGAYTERRTVRRDGGLTGQIVAIEGLSGTSTDVLVRIESLGGATQTERLSPTKTAFVVQPAPRAWEVAATYLQLGIEHILFGFDHLLFVLTLVILVRDWRCVALTVTAFTVAHSITLAAATLGLVNCARTARRGRHRAQHRAGRRRDRECATRDAYPDRAVAVDRCVLLRSFARPRFCRRPGGSGFAASCDPHRTFVLQSRR